MGYTQIFLLKKNVSSFCICKSYSHFFSKNTRELDIVLTRTVNILSTNKLVKLMMFWTIGPWYSKCPKILNILVHTFLAKILLFMQLFLKMLRGMANSEDPDQTASSGTVWPGSALFAYDSLSETLVFKIVGHLSYVDSLYYENTPIQIYWKYYHQKTPKIFK